MKIISKYIIISLFSILISSNVEVHLESIAISISKNDYIDAYNKFEIAISKFDASAILYFKGANIALSLDKLDDANKYFNKAIELDLKNKDYRKSQEKLSLLRNDITNARKTFDSGRIDESIAEYVSLCTKYPENGIVFYNLGKIYKSNGQYSNAVAMYKTAEKLNPYESKYKLAVKAIAQKISKDGDTEYRRQEFSDAIKKYKESITFYPEYTVAYFKLSRTFFKIKDYDSAKEYLEKSLLLDPMQEQVEKMLGDVFLRYGKIDTAIIHYNRAISIDANYTKAYYSLGASLLKIGDYRGSENALISAIALDSSYAKAYGTLGTLYQSQNKLEAAIVNFNSSIDHDSKAYDIYYRLSSVYNQLTNYEMAKKSAKICIDLKRNYAPAYFELGVSEKAMGNNVASKAAFEKAKKDKNWRKLAQYEIDMMNKGF
jgi:tetratricopeptide (TPR) repeat protein